MARLGIIPQDAPRWPWTMGIALFGALAALASLRYLALGTLVSGLGLTVSDVSSIARDGAWWRALEGHAQPALWPLAWLVGPLPDWLLPLGLLVVQALMLSLPLPWLAKRYGAFPALAYFGFFLVWHTGLCDFRPDHLAVPLLFWFFFRVQDERPWTAAIAAICLCALGEGFALQTVACGLYLAVSRRGAVPGMLVCFAGVFWFWLARAKLVPFFTPEPVLAAESWEYAWIGGQGALSRFWWLVSHPLDVAGHVFADPGRGVFLLALLGSLAFLPLLSPGPLVVAFPVLALCLLSARPVRFDMPTAFTAGLVAPLVVAMAQALPVARDMVESRRARVDRWAGLLLLVLVGAHVLFAVSPLSTYFWRSGGIAAIWPNARDTRIIRALEQHLPEDDTVSVASQNSLNWGKAAARGFIGSFPVGVFQPWPTQDSSRANWSDFRRFVLTGERPGYPVRDNHAEYVILDLKRPWYLGDRGCDWDGSACGDSAVGREFSQAVERTRREFDVVVEDDGFLLLKRRPPAPAPEPEPTPAADQTFAPGQDPAAMRQSGEPAPGMGAPAILTPTALEPPVLAPTALDPAAQAPAKPVPTTPVPRPSAPAKQPGGPVLP